MALICACASPSESFGQTSTPASNPTIAKLNTTKANSAGKQAKSGAAPKSTAATVAHNGKSKHTSSRKKKVRGQQKIDAQRAQAIQAALIREHYLSGTAAGTWNQSSEDAMRRYQADHGWQSKTVPDSRALISLGLGPSHDHLLNPESAMTTGPSAPRAASLTPASHSAEPGARMRTPPATTSDQDASDPQ
ncbi:MAG: Peptidoglycan-binding domain 1 [Candidatus Sulfotelmatobacter sp.]|nr:Peptidoglycan-binding domain 1 [Candidatus Sulfotelmatobacter sp.]